MQNFAFTTLFEHTVNSYLISLFFFREMLLSKVHFLQTFLHMIQVFIGYMLMLAFMTFNAWICLAVILGAGLGYFAFGWKSVSIVDIGDHCL